jgi:hypothetical protein
MVATPIMLTSGFMLVRVMRRPSFCRKAFIKPARQKV